MNINFLCDFVFNIFVIRTCKTHITQTQLDYFDNFLKEKRSVLKLKYLNNLYCGAGKWELFFKGILKNHYRLFSRRIFKTGTFKFICSCYSVLVQLQRKMIHVNKINLYG